MSARVSFLSEALDPEAMREKAKLVVPASALAERGGAKVVFVVEEGTAHMRVVRLGAALGSGYELIEGPEAGARVVAEPPATLADGQRVREKGRG